MLETEYPAYRVMRACRYNSCDEKRKAIRRNGATTQGAKSMTLRARRSGVRASIGKDANMSEATPVVGIIMGSESDMPAMEPCMAQLDAMGVPYEVKVASDHRKPAVVHEWAETAHDRGIKVIIAAAGKAAHLGGVVAAFTPLPVIAVPMKTSDLGGLDSLLSMVQMPSGVPVACVAINGAKNAAILAVQMMGTNDEVMLQKVADLKAEMAS